MQSFDLQCLSFQYHSVDEHVAFPEWPNGCCRSLRRERDVKEILYFSWVMSRAKTLIGDLLIDVVAKRGVRIDPACFACCH